MCSHAGKGSQYEQCDKNASSFKRSAGSICWFGNLGPRKTGQDGKMCMSIPLVIKDWPSGVPAQNLGRKNTVRGLCLWKRL